MTTLHCDRARLVLCFQETTSHGSFVRLLVLVRVGVVASGCVFVDIVFFVNQL